MGVHHCQVLVHTIHGRHRGACAREVNVLEGHVAGRRVRVTVHFVRLSVLHAFERVVRYVCFLF